MKKIYKLKFVRKKQQMNPYNDNNYIAIGRKRKRAKEIVFDQKQGGSKKTGTASLLSYMMKYAGDNTVNIRDRIDEIVSKNNLGVSPHTKGIVENLMQMAKYTKKFKVGRVGDFTIKALVDFKEENSKLRSGELYAESVLSSILIKNISSAHYTSSKPLLNPEDTSFLVWEIIDGYPEFEVTDLYVASLSELDLLTKDNIVTKDSKPGFLTVTAKIGDKI